MRIALAQINPTVGDLPGNVARCVEVAEQARRAAADLVVLPEMVIPGYSPRDILLDRSFTDAVQAATLDLAERVHEGPPVIAGTVMPAHRQPPGHPGLYNAAVLLESSEVHSVAYKRLLPVYDVFHEPRWFLPGPPRPPIKIAGRQLGVLVCEDMWDEGYHLHPPADLAAMGADMFVVLAAGPYRQGVMVDRLYHARRHACLLIHLNMVGATDELIFDGRSFALNAEGQIVARLAAFEEDFQVIDLDNISSIEPPILTGEDELHRALTLGVCDFAQKNNLSRAFLGLSGGIDSALTAVIAADALGPERVTGVAIPSRYTDPRSIESARALARSLDIGFEVVDLEPLHAAAEDTLADLLDGDEGTTSENVQARLRALTLMAYVNRHGGFLINTSNKTELTLGYSTIYGDMAGTLSPIGDLTKVDVLALARWIHAERGLIPAFTLERPPSAELRPGQVDPFDYDEVAPAMEALVQANRSNHALRRSEHKRWQMGVILRVTAKAFGSGRLIPITRR